MGKPVRKQKKAISPYTRYGKSPFQYSETYRQWRAAIKDGDKDRARRLAARHADQFGYGVESFGRVSLQEAA